VFTVIAASALAGLTALIAIKLHAGRSCRESRSVRLHVPLEVAWTGIRDFGALQAAHGRGRSFLRVESSRLRRGDGLTPGSVWRQEGRWGDEPWWSDIEIISIDPSRRLEVTLLQDVFGTQAGLAYHRCILDLKAEGARTTKLTFRLRARTRGARLTLARTFSPALVYARLLDLSLRSLKVAVEGLARSEPGAGTATADTLPGASFPAGIPATSFASAAMPAAASPSHPVVRDRV